MNKKTYTIIAIILIIAVVSVLLALNYPNVDNNEKNMVGEDQAGNLPNLPVEISQVEVLRVEDINDANQIKNSYDDFVSQDYKNFRHYEKDGISNLYSPSDKDINLVPIDTFLRSIGANINSNVKSIAGESYYGLFYCINETKQKEHGIALDLNNKDSAKTKSNFDSAGDAMVAWEPYLLKDMRNILFPSDKLSETDISQSLSFKDGKYRYAEVNFPSGKNSINYKVVGDPLNLIIIATSQDCITKAIELFEALD